MSILSISQLSYGLIISSNLMYYREGYGHMIHQHQHLEMQPSIVELRSCLLSGTANLIVWYVAQC